MNVALYNCMFVLLLLTVFLLKFAVTVIHVNAIEFAIFKYHLMQMINNTYDPEEVLYKYLKPFECILFNFFDWSRNNILPPDKYELIKPYLNDEK